MKHTSNFMRFRVKKKLRNVGALFCCCVASKPKRQSPLLQEKMARTTLDNVVKDVAERPELVEAARSIAKERETKEKAGLLLATCDDISDEFKAALTQDVYTALLALIDLSYAYAYLYRGENSYIAQIVAIQEKEIAESKLNKLSFRLTHQIVHGNTGDHDQTPDATCVLSWTDDRSLIFVCFHGSTSDKMWDYFSKEGDWGSNWDYFPVKAGSVNQLQSDVPSDVEMHGSYARNYASVHDELKQAVEKQLLARKDGQKTWIIFTGHSKGGALTTFAAAAVKSYLSKCQVAHYNVGVLALSSPRIMHGDQSQAWVHEMVGQANILRLNVNHDVVPLLPMNWLLHFRHVGVCKLDDTKRVYRRVETLYNVDVTSWWKYGDINAWAPLHYGDSLRIKEMVSFDSDIILPYELLKKPTERVYGIASLTFNPYSTF